MTQPEAIRDIHQTPAAVDAPVGTENAAGISPQLRKNAERMAREMRFGLGLIGTLIAILIAVAYFRYQHDARQAAQLTQQHQAALQRLQVDSAEKTRAMTPFPAANTDASGRLIQGMTTERDNQATANASQGGVERASAVGEIEDERAADRDTKAPGELFRPDVAPRQRTREPELLMPGESSGIAPPQPAAAHATTAAAGNVESGESGPPRPGIDANRPSLTFPGNTLPASRVEPDPTLPRQRASEAPGEVEAGLSPQHAPAPRIDGSAASHGDHASSAAAEGDLKWNIADEQGQPPSGNQVVPPEPENVEQEALGQSEIRAVTPNASATNGPAALDSRAIPAQSGVLDRSTYSYTVGPNENYWLISKRLYGSGAYFKALYEHNRRKFPLADGLRAGDVISTPSLAELEQKYPQLCPARGPR
jgi:nucleoid-associated protein YgaU